MRKASSKVASTSIVHVVLWCQCNRCDRWKRCHWSSPTHCLKSASSCNKMAVVSRLSPLLHRRWRGGACCCFPTLAGEKLGNPAIDEPEIDARVEEADGRPSDFAAYALEISRAVAKEVVVNTTHSQELCLEYFGEGHVRAGRCRRGRQVL